MALLRCPRPTMTESTLDVCKKLQLPDNVAAYIGGRELDRDVVQVDCNKEVMEKVCSNYLIIKNILSHLPWQERIICKQVCWLWHGIVHTLRKEQLSPVDFSVNAKTSTSAEVKQIMVKSMEFYMEPLAVFTFSNALDYTVLCENIVPTPCQTVCEKEHSVLDFIHRKTTAPKDCMYSVKMGTLSYFPLPNSPTYDNMLRKPGAQANGFLCGVYIPKIPGVEFKVLNVKDFSEMQSFKKKIKLLTDKYVVKGVVACLTDNYLLYADQDDVEYLEFLRTMQPDTPFAFCGCLVEDTANTADDLLTIVYSANREREFISNNLMSFGMFLIPKDQQNINFEIYSLVIESTEWNNTSIQRAMQEFSQKVPQFEHSVALKLSCVGREKKHDTEQQQFRKYFPNTRQAGCFGNGELGVNHPRRKPRLDAMKRPRDDIIYEKVHSYSTVFFHICWGKVLAEPEIQS